MKAIDCTKYGSPDVLQLKEVSKLFPKANEVLIRVFAASVTTADCMMQTGFPLISRLFMGLLKPKNTIPGTGFAGEIEAVGNDVKLIKKVARFLENLSRLLVRMPNISVCLKIDYCWQNQTI